MNYSATILTENLQQNDTCLPIKEECIPRSSTVTVVLVIYALTVFPGIPANIAVLCALCLERQISFSTDLITFSLTLIDSFVCIANLLHLCSVFLPVKLSLHCLALVVFGIFGRPLFLVCICIDRYLAVIHPLVFLHLKENKKHKIIFCMVAWAASLSIYLFMIFTHFIYTIELSCVYFPVVFIFIFACNLSIAKDLKRLSPGSDRVHPIKKAALKRVSLVLVNLTLCYFPVAFFMPLYYVLCNRNQIMDCNILFILCSFVYLGSCVEPLFYLWCVNKLLSCYSFVANAICKCTN